MAVIDVIYAIGSTQSAGFSARCHTYILAIAKLDATGQHWVASLANYDFKLFYRSGCINVKADALSRILWSTELEIQLRPLAWQNPPNGPLCMNTWGSSLTKLH